MRGLGLVKVNCAKNSNLCATTLCPIALVSSMHGLAEPTFTVTVTVTVTVTANRLFQDETLVMLKIGSG
jgi:hypothetical protein